MPTAKSILGANGKPMGELKALLAEKTSLSRDSVRDICRLFVDSEDQRIAVDESRGKGKGTAKLLRWNYDLRLAGPAALAAAVQPVQPVQTFLDWGAPPLGAPASLSGCAEHNMDKAKQERQNMKNHKPTLNEIPIGGIYLKPQVCHHVNRAVGRVA